jgi:general stress protein 26
MENRNEIGIISTRIKQLQSAVLHTYSNDVLNLPDITVHAIDVDELGCVWFTILKDTAPEQLLTSDFYVSLNFFKKELPFFLNISGVAQIVTDQKAIKQLPEFVKSNVTEERLLVSVKIMDAEYFEHEKTDEHTWFQKCKSMFSSVFVNEDYPLVVINESKIA